jgi:[methyl-Co(III) methanol-specific corrinoid protein]:coenzyme M methyltransferase
VDWAEKDNWATSRGRLTERPEDLKFPKDYLRHETCTCVLDSLRELKRRHPDVLIIGKTMGPWTLGYHFFGTQDFLLMTIDDPDATMRAIHILKEITGEFGLAQIEASADVLTLPDHATGDLVNAEYYRRFLFDIHCELASVSRAP